MFGIELRCGDAAELRAETERASVAMFAAGAANDLLFRQAGAVNADGERPGRQIALQGTAVFLFAGRQAVATEGAGSRVENGNREAAVTELQKAAAALGAGNDAVAATGAAFGKFAFGHCPRRPKGGRFGRAADSGAQKVATGAVQPVPQYPYSMWRYSGTKGAGFP